MMATNFLRSLSQRFTKSKNRQTQPEPLSRHPAAVAETEIVIHRPNCQCRVQLLDQTELNLAIGKAAMGQELYDRVFAHLELDERDYFGLQFTDHFRVQHWLDPAKKLRKQISVGPPYNLRFRVKFFPNEPSNIRDELTGYLFFLQIRHDIQSGRLECNREALVELCALALQSEFGDFNARDHSASFISEFRFHPVQDDQIELAILRQWANRELAGLSPCQAEMAFLNRARRLPLYGVDLHPVLGRDGQEYRLGLSPEGMLVLDGSQKIGLFLWERIQSLDFRGRRLSLVVEEDMPPAAVAQTGGQLVQLHTFLFHLTSSRAAKHLWKCAIEFHTFFRLKFPRPPQQQRRVLPPLFRLGSTFRYRGRTEYETIHRRDQQQQPQQQQHQSNDRRCHSAFAERQLIRRPSHRHAPRGAGAHGPTTLIPVNGHQMKGDGDGSSRPGTAGQHQLIMGNDGKGAVVRPGKPISTEL